VPGVRDHHDFHVCGGRVVLGFVALHRGGACAVVGSDAGAEDVVGADDGQNGDVIWIEGWPPASSGRSAATQMRVEQASMPSRGRPTRLLHVSPHSGWRIRCCRGALDMAFKREYVDD
jgi:hypothetical protein